MDRLLAVLDRVPVVAVAIVSAVLLWCVIIGSFLVLVKAGL